MKRFISLVLVLLMITTMLPLGMMAIAETAPSWVIEDFENISQTDIQNFIAYRHGVDPLLFTGDQQHAQGQADNVGKQHL